MIEVMESEDALRMRGRFGDLSDEERALVMRRYTSGTSLAEYARETGYSSSSLRSVLQRLRIALRRCITARLATEPYTG